MAVSPKAPCSRLLVLPVVLSFGGLGGCGDQRFTVLATAEGGAGASAGSGGSAGAGGSAGTSGGAGSSGSAGSSAGAGSGGSAGSAGACADPLIFADPDVDTMVQQALARPSGPLHPADVVGLTDLNLISSNAPTCLPPGKPFDCIDYVSPPKADGWVTSLGGIACIPNLQSLALDPIRVNLAPLAQLPHLATIWFGPVLESTLPPLPQVTTLTVRGLSGNEAAVFYAFPSLKALHLSGAGVRDISALVGLVALSVLDLSGNQIMDLSPLVSNPGIGNGATVDITNNPFSCAAQMQNIAALRQRGVALTTDCP